MSSRDANTLYAANWDFRRKGWTFRSGGDSSTAPSASGLLKSTDGGATWKDLDEKSAQGLPAKPWGRVAVASAPSNPDVVYAVIEANHSGLYRSADGGKTWQEGDRSQMMIWRPFYFANLIIDPKDENKVYKAGGSLIVSNDGGKSFSPIQGGAHGDFHDVWIDPQNPDEIITCDDGGTWLSRDSGETWLKAYSLPVGQFYHVAVDMADPYRVYGGLQDNSDWVGDSSYPGGVTNHRWENLYGGDGFFTFPDPQTRIMFTPKRKAARFRESICTRWNRALFNPNRIMAKANCRSLAAQSCVASQISRAARWPDRQRQSQRT